MLDMTSIESGKFELNYGEFSLEKMLVDVNNVVELSVSEKKQNFIANVDDKIPPIIICDEQRLRQVIIILLSNAIKFTPPSGNITLDMSASDISGDACTILIEVVDDGIGIAAEKRSKLFLPFEQIDGGVARKYGGTGLGLYMCKQIVEQMGGRIWVESKFGHGSKFSFTITARKGKEPPQPQALDNETNEAETGPRISETRTILIVEDVEINRLIVEEMLSETGLVVECAEDGRVAVDMYKADPDRYCLILMDINMPEMDGYTATRHIRAESADIPIIAMTANVFQEDIDKCLSTGMNDHIGKPIDAGLLVSKVCEHLEKHRKQV
jgi:CheY-like chemotaxis protein